MKYTIKLLLIAFLIFCLSGCKNTGRQADFSYQIQQMNSFVENQNYFALKQSYTNNRQHFSEMDRLYFGSIIENVFNNAEISNQMIETLLSEYQQFLSQERMNKIYKTRLLNHINLYEYAKAAETSSVILEKFRNFNTTEEIENLENEIKIWQALAAVPKQQVIKNSDTTIPMTRDKVGLLNVDVKFADKVKPFLFDTGANFSVITRSQMEQLNLQYIEADFYVTAATGSKVRSGVAIADKLELQGIEVRNVVFLVFEDKDMSFPQIEYFPNGAIGFPVIEALQEIQIDREDSIFVPKEAHHYGYDNFALDGLMPIVAVEYEHETLSFHLDTGANKTSLFPEFFKKFKHDIETNYKLTTHKASGAGGEQQFKGYVLNDLIMKIANAQSNLSNIRLHIEDIGGEKSNFHGNLGQDFIKQYDKMILSFVNSSVVFE